MKVVSETEFSERIRAILIASGGDFGCVTGPGRSGAIAAVYASHILRIPFIPFGQDVPEALRPVLIIDTARESGETLRKASRKYAYAGACAMVCFEEPPRVMFWYESGKPQTYRHAARGIGTWNHRAPRYASSQQAHSASSQESAL